MNIDEKRITHLKKLEAESIHIMREVIAEFDNPAMLYSIGKDSSVMLHLAQKAFYPAPPPFPLVHVDTTWKFKEMIEFRDQRAQDVGMDLIVYINPKGAELNISPFEHGSTMHTDIMKTEGLRQMLDKYQFDAVFGGARRDEEKSRAKERIYSFRDKNHRWDPKNQRPELWDIYNGRHQKGESIRVFPLSNWTELDIWQYIYLESIPIPDLYFAKERPVVEYGGTKIMVDDNRMPESLRKTAKMEKVRFRTLGCYPLTGAVPSDAETLPAIIQEMLLTKVSERQGRLIDHDEAGSMEKKKWKGISKMAIAENNLIESDIEAYLKQHENKELLRFITCGSVDDGKSTLIGRLLHDSKMIFEDQLAAINKDSKKHGTTGDEIDLALLVDGLQSEREQGITIDVAYRFFATDKRKYIIADTPGHEQYTRNMATGASTADLSIILIDARHGVQTQTKRHSYISNLLGIKHLVIAVNKMDLVEFSEGRFNEIVAEYTQFAKELGIENPVFTPVSALTGDNVVNPSDNMTWFKGPSLMQLLDSIEIGDVTNYENFRFPVQYVNRPHLDFRGFCGTIASGEIEVGDAITVLPSGKTSTVKEVIAPTTQEPLNSQTAFAPMAVTLTLEDEVDISRGDMIVKTSDLPEVADHLEVMLVWMSEQPMSLGRDYLIKRATNVTPGRFTQVDYQVDVNTLKKGEAEGLELNEIGQCQLNLNQMISFDPYHEIKGTGSFIVIDRYTNATLAAGMILRKSSQQSSPSGQREYSAFEEDLNALIRQHFPEWQCRSIEELIKA